MRRRCSHCGNNGHNSRTCRSSRPTVAGGGAAADGGLRLFGVQVQIPSSSSSPVTKSFSFDCLPTVCYNASTSPSSSSSSSSHICIDEAAKNLSGYLSDGLMERVQERRKGVPWSEEEHRAFLAGLEKLGKGDWRGISHNFVVSRTPTQVASHAQKYFLRKNILDKKKRRSSLFDVVRGNQSLLHVQDSSEVKDHSFLNRISGVSIDLNSAELETSHFPPLVLDLKLSVSSSSPLLEQILV